MNPIFQFRLTGQTVSLEQGQTAPPAPSEIGSELGQLVYAVEQLCATRDELVRRLVPVSRGAMPESTAKGQEPAPVIHSSVAKSIADARQAVEQVTRDIHLELSSLAV